MEKEFEAPRGMKLNCKGWQQEAALRMLLNNLDSAVAENPQDLVVYGGTGKAARNRKCLLVIIEALKKLDDDETLLIQSGKAVGIFKTHTFAPRVLIANSLLVPAWADWDTFRELEQKGLTMYGQMTAGSWIYIGSQGILQGTYETFAQAAAQHFGGSLRGKLVLSAGLGGMGGAQPLAITMNGGIALIVEVDPVRIEKRLQTKYCDMMMTDLNEALEEIRIAKQKGRPLSIALQGNASEIFPALYQRDIIPDLITDQTSAHDILNGYIPGGYSVAAANKLRKKDPQLYIDLAGASIKTHVQAMLDFQEKGSIVFDYGNNIREQARKKGLKNAFDFPGFVPAFIRPLFCQGKGPFRWVALSGDEEDIYKIDTRIKELFPQDKRLINWIELAKTKVSFQGLPARICWLGQGDRAKLGVEMNRMVARGELKAPVVIGRDHLDTGSVASPYRETEAMKDGSDAIADWPILNALLNTSCGASWVSVHHGGGVGIGYSLHAGMVIVADGTKEAEERLQRVLTADPGLGVLRHADAGYDEAKKTVKEQNLKMPMLD